MNTPKQPKTASAQVATATLRPENVPVEGNGPEWIRPYPASASQNREPLKEQPLPNEYISKDILDLQETIRLMVYAPLEERQRLAWKFVGPFNPIPVIPPPEPNHDQVSLEEWTKAQEKHSAEQNHEQPNRGIDSAELYQRIRTTPPEPDHDQDCTCDTPAKPAHTPGPWKVQVAAGTVSVTCPQQQVAKMVEFPKSSETDANARLIAAAPETAAERDRLRAEVTSYEKTCAIYTRDLAVMQAERNQARKQVKTLLAVCKDVHAMLSQPVAFSDESANDQKSLEILRGDCFAARQQLHAASVESEGVK